MTHPEMQQDATLFGGLRLDLSDSRHAPLQTAQDLRKGLGVVVEQEFHDEGEVLSLTRQVLGVARFGLRSRPADMEIGEVPVLDQVTQGHHRREALELRQSLDGEDVRTLERLLFALELLFIGD